MTTPLPVGRAEADWQMWPAGARSVILALQIFLQRRYPLRGRLLPCRAGNSRGGCARAFCSLDPFSEAKIPTPSTYAPSYGP
jgi:hypothetical protein